MNRRAIRVRLAFWYSVVLLCGLVLFGALVWVAMFQQTMTDVDNGLSTHAQGLEEYLRIEEAEDVSTLAHELSELSGSLPANYSVEVVSPAHRSLFSSGDASLLFQDARAHAFGTAANPSDFRRKVEWRGNHYRLLAHPVSLVGGEYWIIIAAATDPALRAGRQLGLVMLGTIPTVVIIAAIGGFLLSARALAPVAAMTNAARLIGIEDLSRRLPVPNANDEVQQLATTWNDMLARLEIAVTRISQFTSDASHELRTPIAIIRSTAEIALRRERPESHYREALRQIETESERMTQLVSDLLFLARAGDHAVSAEMIELDLRRPIQEACEEIAPLASDRSIEMNLEHCPDSLPVIGHESSLRRMLLAVLENAVKYTPPGGKVTVSVERDANLIRLITRDTGCGIPESALPHIFERFYRADPSRNRGSGGHGLGLAIAQTIALQHYGSIEVESQAGAGSRFSITLPLYAASDATNDSRAASAVRAKSSPV